MLIALLFAYGCADDRYLFGHDEPGEGDAMLTAEISFKNYTPALTRTPGNTLNGIENLFVFIYKENGSLVEIKEYKKSELDSIPNYNPPSDGEGMDVNNNGELTLPTFKTTLKNIKLPYGRYQIYAAANIRGEYADALRDPEGVAKTVDGLKSFKVRWNSNNIGYDDQMFGYFMEMSADEKAPSSSKGFGPNVITINQPNVRIGAWLRRLASKVTVAYDASGLNQGVWVYIKNVTVHDIAAECYLGQKNEPSESELLNRRTGEFNQPDATYTPDEPNTRITYEGKPSANLYDKNQKGLELYNGLVTPEGKPILLGSNHSANDKDALFFYENMQGDHSTDDNKADYDKRQHGSGKDQVGENVRDDDGKGNDYKDRVKSGTYVEVEAYYISLNPANPSQGPIKYRFMLGKDKMYNYDVERNYHFKLTLGFKGWANQPDWHIDYDITEPTLEVPPIYHVSYLYHQKSYLPVRVSDNCTNLNVKIIENNWVPSDPKTYEFLPNQNFATGGTENYDFKWTAPAFYSTTAPIYRRITHVPGIDLEVNTAAPYLGFLALNVAEDLPVTVPVKSQSGSIINYYSFKDQQEGQDKMATYFTQKFGDLGSQQESTFDAAMMTYGPHTNSVSVNNWEVNKLEDGTENSNKIVMVPMWTRARTIIEGAGFSGNNPYEYYVRKATLEVTGTYDMGVDENGNKKDPETRTEYVTVIQEPRIVNPKAIWRKGGNGESKFHVELMTKNSSNQKADYTPLFSDGEWTAEVEYGSNVSLSTSATTLGREENGVIFGKTGSKVDFDINIKGDGCAIVNVLYHNKNCTHKIFVRQGSEPTTTINGTQWSNYTLYSATSIDGTDNEYDGVETADPLILGSLYRRGNSTQGILPVNNELANLGPFQSPGSTRMSLTDGSTSAFTSISTKGSNEDPGTMGRFRINGQWYKLPSLNDFNGLKFNCEFALGVIYGNDATTTETDYNTATGYWSEDLTAKGVRAVIAYDKEKANQVVFPLGKYGYSRRKFNGATDAASGMLIYSDVNFALTTISNRWRPAVGNLRISPGAIYWLDQRYATGFLGNTEPGPTMSWDINYFNYDFNSFDNSGTSNWQDACAIKLVKE